MLVLSVPMASCSKELDAESDLAISCLMGPSWCREWDGSEGKKKKKAN